jgi:hypothetical protein
VVEVVLMMHPRNTMAARANRKAKPIHQGRAAGRSSSSSIAGDLSTTNGTLLLSTLLFPSAVQLRNLEFRLRGLFIASQGGDKLEAYRVPADVTWRVWYFSLNDTGSGVLTTEGVLLKETDESSLFLSSLLLDVMLSHDILPTGALRKAGGTSVRRGGEGYVDIFV